MLDANFDVKIGHILQVDDSYIYIKGVEEYIVTYRFLEENILESTHIDNIKAVCCFPKKYNTHLYKLFLGPL